MEQMQQDQKSANYQNHFEWQQDGVPPAAQLLAHFYRIALILENIWSVNVMDYTQDTSR